MQSRRTPKIGIGDLVRKKYIGTAPLCIVVDFMSGGAFDYIKVFYKNIHPIEASRWELSHHFDLISGLDLADEEKSDSIILGE